MTPPRAPGEAEPGPRGETPATAPAGAPVAVLGAGCAGLAAGLRLARGGHPVVLLEAADRVGGLSGGVELGGNIYEYGPHVFHTTDQSLLDDVIALAGDELIEYDRTIRIKFRNAYFQFPLKVSDVLRKLPPATVLRAGLSFAWHFVAGRIRRPAVETSETILMRYYGVVLYEIFFRDYIEHVWGIPPSGFSPAFARQRIPRMNLLQALDTVRSAMVRRLKGAVRTEDYVENVEGVLYTTRHGFSLIARKMADEIERLGGRVLLGAEVTRLLLDGNRVRAVGYARDGKDDTLACRGVISTLPVNAAVAMMEPPRPPEVLRAAGALRFRALVFVGLLVRRPEVLPASFMYFREHSFNRITDLAHFGFHIAPDDCTQLVAEICCNVGDREWTDDAFASEAVIEDLVGEGLLDRGEIVEVHVFRTPHAYPIYLLGYEANVEKVLNAVGGTANMETAGRQGRFQYVNSHIAMKMGQESADRLLEKLGPPR